MTDAIGEEWFVFSSGGHASLVIADSLTKAIAKWKKSPVGKKAEAIGVIKAAGPVTIDNIRMQHTHVYGVICCVQEKGAA
jgi:hypothetical protein